MTCRAPPTAGLTQREQYADAGEQASQNSVRARITDRPDQQRPRSGCRSIRVQLPQGHLSRGPSVRRRRFRCSFRNERDEPATVQSSKSPVVQGSWPRCSGHRGRRLWCREPLGVIRGIRVEQAGRGWAICKGFPRICCPPPRDRHWWRGRSPVAINATRSGGGSNRIVRYRDDG